MEENPFVSKDRLHQTALTCYPSKVNTPDCECFYIPEAGHRATISCRLVLGAASGPVCHTEVSGPEGSDSNVTSIVSVANPPNLPQGEKQPSHFDGWETMFTDHLESGASAPDLDRSLETDTGSKRERSLVSPASPNPQPTEMPVTPKDPVITPGLILQLQIS